MYEWNEVESEPHTYNAATRKVFWSTRYVITAIIPAR